MFISCGYTIEYFIVCWLAPFYTKCLTGAQEGQVEINDCDNQHWHKYLWLSLTCNEHNWVCLWSWWFQVLLWLHNKFQSWSRFLLLSRFIKHNHPQYLPTGYLSWELYFNLPFVLSCFGTRLWLEGIQLRPDMNNEINCIPIRLCFINIYAYPNPKPTPYSNEKNSNYFWIVWQKLRCIDVRTPNSAIPIPYSLNIGNKPPHAFMIVVARF